MLVASSYGFGSCGLNPFMMLRDAEPIKEVLDDFGIPANHIVWVFVALGYPVKEQHFKRKGCDQIHIKEECMEMGLLNETRAGFSY